MKAILIDQPGDESVLQLGDTEPPTLSPGSLRIAVAAAGVNRADLLQRQGHYPSPPGESPILGLECAGEVMEGEGVEGWRSGDRVMALLAGGGYAEQVVVPAGCVMPIPEKLSSVAAAALPEVLLTVFLNVFQLGDLREGGSVLVHGGGSGIGTAAIQMVKAAGGRCLVTAGSEEKCQRCLDLGADVAINYRSQDFLEEVRSGTEGQGVNLVLDSIGGSYLERNLKCLAMDGRLVVIGLMGGGSAPLSMGLLLTRRLQVIGSTLRMRPVEEKARIIAGFRERFWGDLDFGRIAPVVDSVFDLSEAADAHRLMKASSHFGKILLRVGEAS